MSASQAAAVSVAFAGAPPVNRWLTAELANAAMLACEGRPVSLAADAAIRSAAVVMLCAAKPGLEAQVLEGACHLLMGMVQLLKQQKAGVPAGTVLQ